MSKVYLSDLVLRDGHQSLIATRLRTEHMLPICARLDNIGFWSLEAWGGATFDACVRFLKEDPWERLAKLRKALPNTPIQMLLRGQNLLGYRHYADDVVRAFVKKSADNGVDVFRIFDAMNDLRNMQVSVAAVLQAGKHAQGAISYTTSPVHDIPHFVTLAKSLADFGCQSIAIKDMAGLLTPAVATELVSAIRQATGLPVHTHSHATSGLASMTLLKAVEAGASMIDTCISAFSEGASHPTTESMVAALAGTPYDTGIKLADLEEIAAYFREIRKLYWQYESSFTGVDPRVLISQVPGGMISNLSNQLKEQRALDRMDEVLAEIPRVRADLGYPPLVTPTSQIVGTQAVLNVLSGGRYKTITNEVKLYFQGRYGQTPAPVNSEIRSMAIGTQDVIHCRPADLIADEMDKLRNEIEGIAQCEEDVLTYAMFPDLARTFLQERNADTLTPEVLLPISAKDAGNQTPRFAADEFRITLHGESYHIRLTGTGRVSQSERPYYVTVDGVSEEVFVEALNEVEVNDAGSGDSSRRTTAAKSTTGSRPRPSHAGHVTTAMPGNIVDVLVSTGQQVKAGDPVLVIEAMKMENEIQATIAGTIINLFVIKGDTVTPDQALLEIQPE